MLTSVAVGGGWYEGCVDEGRGDWGSDVVAVPFQAQVKFTHPTRQKEGNRHAKKERKKYLH